MVFNALSIGACRLSLHGPGAELEGVFSNSSSGPASASRRCRCPDVWLPGIGGRRRYVAWCVCVWVIHQTAAVWQVAAVSAVDPFLLPMLQVDKGAIRFVLSGANIMCPGLTSSGAKMTSVPEKTPVAIMAEGKHHALAVGITKLSTDDM